MTPTSSLALLLALSSFGFRAHAARVAPQTASLTSSASDDLINRIPAYEGDKTFEHYSGYITVGEHRTKHLFYYLAKAQEGSSKAPTILWLNGGPGCSSFGGFAYEVGPFKFRLHSQHESEGGYKVILSDNPYSWDSLANVLFLDSPVGVGLSYSDNPDVDYHTGDIKTAKDAHDFMRSFYEKYPELRYNELYLAGESYAGVYLPNLAREIMRGNEAGAHPKINLAGYMIGNPTCSEEIDGNALPRFALGKSMLQPRWFAEMEAACDGGHYWNRTLVGPRCERAFNDLLDLTDGVGYYDILLECYAGPDDSAEAELEESRWKAQEKAGRVWPMLGTTPKAGQQVKNWAHLGFRPKCSSVDSRQVEAWLNDPVVRRGIHAASERETGQFEPCTDRVNYTREHEGDMIPIHRDLLEHFGLRALIYSGDHDMCIPHTGTETWTSSLGYAIKSPWQPWYYRDSHNADQVAGFTVEYEHLTYATVKGGGHMVPQTNPVQAFQMVERFLSKMPLYSPKK